MNNKRKEIARGIVLIGIGLLILLASIGYAPNLGLLFLPLLGAGFLLWGIFSREDGLIVPGGILSGIGWGVYLMNGPFAEMDSMSHGGIFLMSFALGFASITLFTAVFTDETHWWALIPGAIIGFVGLAVATQGLLLDILGTVGKYWPLVLIVLGIYVIVKGIRQPDEIIIKEKSPTEKMAD